MKFSIIIVTFNRKKALIACLQSIRAQSLKMPHEVIVILNGDLAYIEKYRTSFPGFHFTHIPFTTTANARNIAIKKAKGEYVLFLNEDSVLPNQYFENVNFELGWDVLGGPDLPPTDAPPFHKLVGRALASPLCMGAAYKRHSSNTQYDSKAKERNLIIANLWFKKSLFSEEGFQFNKTLFKNDEYHLLSEMAKQAKVFHYNPSLFVFHQGSPNMEKLGAAIIKNGKCRAHNYFSNRKQEDVLMFTPLLFGLFFLLMIFHPNVFFVGTILLYTVAILSYDLFHHKRLSLRLVVLHYLIQFCYGVGLIRGIISGIPEAYINFKANRSLINESRSK